MNNDNLTGAAMLLRYFLCRFAIHADQGSQFTSKQWLEVLKSHNLYASMSTNGNCYDNAVAESFFQLLKSKRIRWKTYKAHKDARDDVLNYIEFFYISERNHGNNGWLSPKEYERLHA